MKEAIQLHISVPAIPVTSSVIYPIKSWKCFGALELVMPSLFTTGTIIQRRLKQTLRNTGKLLTNMNLPLQWSHMSAIVS